MKNQPMLMSLRAENYNLYLLVKSYYQNEQIKLGRTKKQIVKDFDQLTCFGTCKISSCISFDNTKEGRQFWTNIENQFLSIYNI